MSSEYIVVQFTNMITGECLNLGVYTYDLDKTEVYSRFTIDWNRFKVVFGTDKDFILDEIVSNWLSKITTKDALQEAIKGSNGPYSSLYFVPPRASLLAAEALLEDIAKDLLVL